MESRTDIAGLVGEELNTVAFVMDYVEFHFNGPVLRALTGPVVSIGTLQARFPEPGSRDRLCELIGRQVSAVTVVDDVALDLSFKDGASLRIPLDPANRSGPEAAHFQADLINAPVTVW